MSIQESHDYFDLLTDKSSAYFTDPEKDSFITNACLEYVKALFPSAENPGLNIEIDQINFNNVYTLIFTTAGLNMSGGGVITTATLQSALDTASSSTEPFMAILGLDWTKGEENVPVKFTRHNNWFSYLGNSFKSGSSTAPRYRQDKTNFTFYPIDTGASIKFTLLKQPRAVNLDDEIDIELPSHCHKAIVELAVDIASTSLREQSLKQLNAS